MAGGSERRSAAELRAHESKQKQYHQKGWNMRVTLRGRPFFKARATALETKSRVSFGSRISPWISSISRATVENPASMRLNPSSTRRPNASDPPREAVSSNPRFTIRARSSMVNFFTIYHQGSGQIRKVNRVSSLSVTRSATRPYRTARSGGLSYAPVTAPARICDLEGIPSSAKPFAFDHR